MNKIFFEKLSKINKSGQFYLVLDSKNSKMIGLKVFITEENEIITSNEDLKNEFLTLINDVNINKSPEIYNNNSELSFFSEYISTKPTIVLCGGGHVSKSVYNYAITLGFDVIVIDDRPEFANYNVFPKAKKIISRDFKISLNEIKIDNAFYVIVTRGHVNDTVCAEIILKKNYKYLGMIGSKRKVSIVKNHLINNGFCEGTVNKINAPIGIDIGAQTPDEIGISIIAEIISYRRKENVESYLDDEVFGAISKNNGKLSFCMILDKKGSIPRGAGSKMVVTKSGEIIGSIGGGAIEFDAINQCQKFENFMPKIYEYSMKNDDATKEGMSCGGQATVYIENMK